MFYKFYCGSTCFSCPKGFTDSVFYSNGSHWGSGPPQVVTTDAWWAWGGFGITVLLVFDTQSFSRFSWFSGLCRLCGSVWSLSGVFWVLVKHSDWTIITLCSRCLQLAGSTALSSEWCQIMMLILHAVGSLQCDCQHQKNRDNKHSFKEGKPPTSKCEIYFYYQTFRLQADEVPVGILSSQPWIHFIHHY